MPKSFVYSVCSFAIEGAYLINVLSNVTMKCDVLTYLEGGVDKPTMLLIDGDNVMSPSSAIYIGKSGELTLENNVCVVNNKSNITSAESGSKGSGIYNEGKLTLIGAKVYDNQSSYGGAIYSTGEIVIQDNTHIYSNDAYRGGAIYVAGNGTLSIEGENILIEGNDANEGGAIYYASARNSVISGGSFNDNSASTRGGAIAIASNSKGITLDGEVSFTGNTAEYGGAIYVAGSTASSYAVLTVNSAVFSTNEATHGGAILVGSSGSLQMVVINNGSFGGNTADYGGAIEVRCGIVTINGGTFVGNKANVLGGEIYTYFIGSSEQKPNLNIYGGYFGTVNNIGTIAIDENAVFSVGGLVEIFDEVLLLNNAIVNVVNNLDVNGNPIVLIPVVKVEDDFIPSYPATGKSIRVATFANSLTPMEGLFEVESDKRNSHRTKISLQDIVITDAIYDINLVFNGGEIATSLDYTAVEDGAKISLKFGQNIQQKLSQVSITTEGKDFEGWYILVENGDDVLLDASIAMPRKDLTLYAKWSAQYYMVYVSINDTAGISGNKAAISAQSGVSYNEEEGFLSTKVYVESFEDGVQMTTNGSDALVNIYASIIGREGYTFKGFDPNRVGNGEYLSTGYTSGGTPFAVVDGDVVLYVIWVANTYTVSYDANKAGATGAAESQTATYDEYLIVNDQTFTAPGYKHNGWNTKADGTGIFVGLNDRALNLSSGDDVVLYATWTASVYTVIFDNNLPGEEVENSIENEVFTYGIARSLNAENKFITNGYIQTCWNTKSDGQYHM